jgi:dTDP-4-dehydrorhamnose reductase
MSNQILITGAAGKLGKAVLAILPSAIGATRQDFDLSKANEIALFLDKHPTIKTILHCAAMISPPKINEDIAQAIGSNIIGTSLLSAECYKRNIYQPTMCLLEKRECIRKEMNYYPLINMHGQN